MILKHKWGEVAIVVLALVFKLRRDKAEHHGACPAGPPFLVSSSMEHMNLESTLSSPIFSSTFNSTLYIEFENPRVVWVPQKI